MENGSTATESIVVPDSRNIVAAAPIAATSTTAAAARYQLPAVRERPAGRKRLSGQTAAASLPRAARESRCVDHGPHARTLRIAFALQPLEVGAKLGGRLVAEVAVLLERLVE